MTFVEDSATPSWGERSICSPAYFFNGLLRIVPAGDADTPKLQRLISRPDAILADPQEIVHIDWSQEWRP